GRPAPTPGASYVTTGIVTIANAESPAPAKAAPSYLQTRLKQRVEATCGRSARNVEVEVLSPTDVRIRVKVGNDRDNDRVRNQIWSMPELAPYRIHLDVKVGP